MKSSHVLRRPFCPGSPTRQAEGVDSLFDATLFDVVASAAAPAAPVAGAGQLDIFGEEVVVVSVPSSDSESVEPAGPPIDELEDAELRGELGVGAIALDDEAADPGDELNDPTWEPPLDVDDPAANLVRAMSVDALWNGVVGQPEALATLRGAALAPVHAYMLVGPPGSGRRAAARAFAAAVLCPRGGCGECDVCHRALNVVHPDIMEVERDGASISVDQAREIIRLAMRSPVEGEHKVLVLVDFHLVTIAAPTLLKIIEEPPPSTVFVVLADQVTNELVTIASRCVQVRFRPLGSAAVVAALVAEGADPPHAERAARAASGRLDRARLLVHDDQLGERLAFWESVPRRLDGTGAAAAVLAAEAIVRLDGAGVEPMEERHGIEMTALEARLELIGGRGGVGQKKDLVERQKRELKRLRDDELRFGLSVLEHRYRDVLAEGSTATHIPSVKAIEAIRTLNEDLIRNPGVPLALTALFMQLPTVE